MSEYTSTFEQTLKETNGHLDHFSSKELLRFLQVIASADPVIQARPEVQLTKARLLHAYGDEKDAREIFSNLVVSYPNDPSVWVTYAAFLHNIGEAQQALDKLSKAVQIDPNHAIAHQQLGTIFRDAGYFEQAVNHFEIANNLAPDDLEIQRELQTILQRFVPPWHLEMLADHERNQAFESAINKVVNKESRVLDIGTGSGLLSMMAVRAGAEHVTTCEQSPFLVKTARKIIEMNGLSEQIDVHHAKSTELQPHQFEDKPNVLVAEIFDSGLLGEWAIPTFRHALKHLCIKNCQIIPQKAQVIGRLVELPDHSSVHPVQDIMGFDLSPFDIFQTKKQYVRKSISAVRHKFLNEAFELNAYDFKNLGEPIREYQEKTKTFELMCLRDGRVTAIAFWFTLWLDDEIQLSSAPDRSNNHWGQAVFFLEKRKTVRKGDVFKLTMKHNDNNIWFED